MHDTRAYHQAGHVVMAWLQGLSYECVSLEDSTGCRCHDSGLRGVERSDEEVALLTRVAVILGGPVAAEFAPGDGPRDSDDEDYATALLRLDGVLDVETHASDVRDQFSPYRESLDRTVAALTARGTLLWDDVVALLGIPGRSLSVAEQRARARGRTLHRITERLDAERRQLECVAIPPAECRRRIEQLNSLIRSTWSRWVETGQLAMRLRAKVARKSGGELLSVYCNPRALCRAEYRIQDIAGLHVDHFRDEDHDPTPERYLMGYVDCDLMVGGYLCHSCPNGPPPHRLLVIVSERENEPALYDSILDRVSSARFATAPGS